jgi:hypothetical protein
LPVSSIIVKARVSPIPLTVFKASKLGAKRIFSFTRLSILAICWLKASIMLSVLVTARARSSFSY